MVMDENGRNGGKWHLAQQLTYHVTLYIFQQFTQLTYHAIINDITRNIHIGGKFSFIYN